MKQPYDTSVRDSIRQRMSPPNCESVTEIARDTGITSQTLYNWRSHWQKQTQRQTARSAAVSCQPTGEDGQVQGSDEAEAGADQARRREQQAGTAEREAADADAHADAQANQNGALRARAARQRAEAAWGLTINKAETAGHQAPVISASRNPQAMPSRNLPTDAPGNTHPKAQRYFTEPGNHILKGGDGWIQGYNSQAAVDGAPPGDRGHRHEVKMLISATNTT